MDGQRGDRQRSGNGMGAGREAIHILLVDREEDTLDLLGMSLRVSGYRVSTASSAQAARAQIHKELPDVVLLDLPVEADAVELEIARSLRTEPETSGVKVVLHTSLPEAAVSKCFGDYDAFLRKPAPVEQIVETVDAALHREE